MSPLKLPDGSELDVSRVSKAIFWEAGCRSALRPVGQSEDEVRIDTLRIDFDDGSKADQITGPAARIIAIQLEMAFVPVFWRRAESHR